jgi:small-conductance mechanosensitive channel
MIAQFLTRLLLILCLALPLGASAQDSSSPDYTKWDKAASAAETKIEDGDTSSADLEQLRDDLVIWRESFLAAEDSNGTRIDTLKAQIEALGAAPAEGETESAEIAQRRKELNKQLEAAQAPVKTAEEAYTRANGLISEIDQVLTERQADVLMQRAQSPLNPTLWPTAVKALGQSAVTAWTTVSEAARSESGQQTLRSNTAPIVFYLVIALVLVARGRLWSERLTDWVRKRVSGDAGKGVTGFLASIGQIVVPLAGLIAITLAAGASGLLGPRGIIVFGSIPQIGLAYFFWRWIAGRLFYPTGAGEPILDLGAVRRAEATTMGTLAGIMAVLNDALIQLADIDDYSESTLAVLTFPLVAIACLALIRLARILTPGDARSEEDKSEAETEHGFAQLILRIIARVVFLAAVVALLLAAAGYMNASKGIVFPLLRSIGLLGFVAILSRLGYDLYALVTRQPNGAKDALVPVLLSFLIVLASLPIFALLWGMREDQLWELWARLREGISFGGVTISPTNFITLVVVFVIGMGLTRLLKTALTTAVLPKTKIDKGGQNAIVSGAGYVGVVLSAIMAIVAAGIDLSALAIVAGALSVGIGFGLQNIVQNFVSGIILLIERPISEGDWIDLGNGSMGIVKDISVRSTRVETFDKTDLIVPNADLISNQVTNYTRGNQIGRVIIPVGVAYGTDTRRVAAILQEIIEDQPMVTVNPKPQVLFLNFGADALEFEIRAILRDVTYMMVVKNDVNHAIAKRFGEEGIEIPFAQRDIWLRNPEALQVARNPAEAEAAPVVVPETALLEPTDLEPDEGDGEGDGETA